MLDCKIFKESQNFISKFVDKFRGQAGKNRRAGDAMANQAEKSISSLQKSLANTQAMLKQMQAVFVAQSKSLIYFKQINKDAATDKALGEAIMQLGRSKDDVDKIMQQLQYMTNNIANGISTATGRVPAAAAFSPTPDETNIKNIFQAKPAVAMEIMNHVFGKGPTPTQPGRVAVAQYLQKLPSDRKLALRDFFMS
jgi:hypothetical protein